MYKDSLIIFAIILVCMMLIAVFGGCVHCDSKGKHVPQKREAMASMAPIPQPNTNPDYTPPPVVSATTGAVPNAYDDSPAYAAIGGDGSGLKKKS